MPAIPTINARKNVAQKPLKIANKSSNIRRKQSESLRTVPEFIEPSPSLFVGKRPKALALTAFLLTFANLLY